MILSSLASHMLLPVLSSLITLNLPSNNNSCDVPEPSCDAYIQAGNINVQSGITADGGCLINTMSFGSDQYTSWTFQSTGLIRLTSTDGLSEPNHGIWHSEGSQAFYFIPNIRGNPLLEKVDGALKITTPGNQIILLDQETTQNINSESHLNVTYSKMNLDKDPKTPDLSGTEVKPNQGWILDLGFHKGDLSYRSVDQITKGLPYIQGLPARVISATGAICKLKLMDVIDTSNPENSYFENLKYNTQEEWNEFLAKKCPTFR